MSKPKLFLIAVAVILVILIAFTLGFAATRPDTFNVQRTITIKAPSKNIYPLINDYHKWGSWSPWEKIDPSMKGAFSGASTGTGSVYEWESKKIGNGRMEITGSVPYSKIEIKLDFIKPFEAHNITDFTLNTKDNYTTVTWAMRGTNSFMVKVMHLFFNMDSMVGKDFETGLASMKTIAEK